MCVTDATNPMNGFCRAVCDPTYTGTTPPVCVGGASRVCASGMRCSSLSGLPPNFGVCV
jgi:hypothetical protein